MNAIETETTLFYGFIILLIVVLATLLFLLIHAGFFTEIEVKTCKPIIGDVKIAYKAAKGPYKESGALFTEVHSLLPQYRALGIYYDDPKRKEASRLRYAVGIILSENNAPANEEDEKVLSERGYKFAHLPSVDHAVQTSFPFNSTLSIIIGIFRVYPILSEYVSSRSLCAHPFIELYDNEQKKIFYFAPLEKQADFYVPDVPMESCDAEEEEINDSESQSNDGSADESMLANDFPQRSSQDEDNGHTSSSFEEIDEGDANEAENPPTESAASGLSEH